MASKKYRFVSPGVQLRELDRSQIPDEPQAIGPVIIGRAERGPALQPVKVQNFTEFVQIFGNPTPGGKVNDVWRDGNEGLSPQYGAYAAQAWLTNSTPLTFIRLLGREHIDKTPGGEAGWKIGTDGISDTGGSFGLFLIDSASVSTTAATTASFELFLTGTDIEENLTIQLTDADGTTITYVTDYDNNYPTSSTVYRIPLTASDASSTNEELRDALYTAISSSYADGSGSISASIGATTGVPKSSIDLFQTTAGASGNTSFVGSLNTMGYVSGAFGPFAGGSGATTAGSPTGSLAAVWYTKSGYHIALSGTNGAGVADKGTAVMIKNNAGSANGGQWIATLSSSGGEAKKFEFNFDPTSDKFIRKVFNTNATKLNSSLYAAADQENYVLGETYESVIQNNISSGSTANTVYGVILGMHGSDYDVDYNVNQVNSNPASTGWFISQDTGPYASFNPTNARKLFKAIALEHGIWANGNIKISIEDIRYSDDPAEEYGSFSLVVRSTKDKDSAPIVLESFSNLNLNSESPNYIAARIGNQYAQWSDTDRRWRYFGEYENNSRYIYIKTDDGLGDNPTDLPFGYQAPLRPVGIKAFSGSANSRGELLSATSAGTGNSKSIPLGSGSLDGSNSGNQFIGGMPTGLTASFTFPATKLRTSTKQGNLSDPTDAYFGVDTVKSNGRFDNSYVDLVRGIPGGNGHEEFGPNTSPTEDASEFSYVFTLDNVSHFTASSGGTLDEYEAYYVSGSRASGKSISASGSIVTNTSNGYKSVIDDGYDRFTAPMHGGFDGIDITQTEPFNNNEMGNSATQLTSYAYNSVRIAIDTCADPENVDMNILSAPGVTVTGLTDRVIDVCESRGDALGIIDIENGFIPPADRNSPGTDYSTTNRGNATTAARDFKARQINNSYGAAYYPWTKVRDSESGKTFFCPPSVAAVGTLSYSQAVSEVWFAPAGFNRGGLTAGAAGIPVVGVTEKLSSKERDKLYEANINPIASFPSEGLVVFGQKTLQTTRSALDRINVRRLLIFIKKEISRISNGLLFDPNTQVTWDRFKGQAVPFLESVKSRLGLEDFKVVLDSTTTTPDLVDRNVMYAKIFLKPTRAIEFIAVDFVITNTGASFED